MSTPRPGTAVATRAESKVPIPLYNGVMSPDKWTLFGRIAQTVHDTDFVPKGLRGKPAAVMACLMYGDSLDLHPSVSLRDIYVADGSVGLSGALMLAKIREAGHKISFEELPRDEDGAYVGVKCIGKRMVYKQVEGETVAEVDEEDSWSYTMADAERAGLYPNSNAKAAWMKIPEVMCRWRALSQLARFLFPDVFRGQAVYTPDEAEEIADSDRRARNAGREGGAAEGEEIQYGDDPLLSAWLIALFAAANDAEPGIWLPKKQALALNGKTQADREELAVTIAAWMHDRGLDVPERPTEDDEETAQEGEIVDSIREGEPSDDPAAHLNGDDEHERVKLD